MTMRCGIILVLAYEWLKDKDNAEAARKRMLALLEQTAKMKPDDAAAQATIAAVYAHYGLGQQGGISDSDGLGLGSG